MLASALLLVLAQGAPVLEPIPGAERFSMRVVASGLANPWEMILGPDGQLWITERTGKRVVRVNPADGTIRTALVVPDIIQTHNQDGLLGMALHPEFLRNTGNDFAYLAMTYDADPGAAEDRRLRVRRYSYDPLTQTLGQPRDILAGLPGGHDHVSGRLAIGPDRKLYLTIGDGGFNHSWQFCQPIRAQQLPTAAELAAANYIHYEGKILRIGLDGTVPADNPTLLGVRSHVHTYGHRNAQGLAIAPDGRIYASEHGPAVDDELNLILRGRNYGWPFVAGYRDDLAYVYANWSASTPTPCASLAYDERKAPASVPQQKESAWTDPAFTPPLRTFPAIADSLGTPENTSVTIAPSGIDLYASPAIPGWSRSILIASLTRGAIYRVRLDSTGEAIAGPTMEYFRFPHRYRDVLASPDGRTIFAVTDSSAQGSPSYLGSVLAFTIME